ncbi:MerR family transcriptional regulator [Reyranella sp.]|uniref:MerR family transcriptional regulator n=1 Tax=Reyranella sp. TaxID=1929291 RepID=UPI003BA8947B
MSSTGPFLTLSEAARRLGVSGKALRVYEQRGLLAPLRTAAGWRAYGRAEMERAAEIAALRRLGFGLAEIGRMLKADPPALARALSAHQAALESRLRLLAGTLETVRGLRDGLARGDVPAVAGIARLLDPGSGPRLAIDLPWPWGGERFELNGIRHLTYITGPLGSGKTRLAQALAAALPDAAFIGLEGRADGEAVRTRLAGDPALSARVDAALAELAEDGATAGPGLLGLLTVLEATTPAVLVVDMIEQGLDEATQEAVIARLRRQATTARPLFLLTRSTAILDLDSVGPNEAIVYCPANHSPPIEVSPWPGAPGHEALASCLAAPAVRARTEGVIAWRPPVPAAG